MRDRKAIPVLAALAVVAGSVVAVGASGASSPASTSIAFVAHPRGGSQLDLGRKGPSAGDMFFEHGQLAGAAGASGRYELNGQLLRGNARRGAEHVALTLYLQTGTIEVQGGHRLTGRFTLPIVGGTDAYDGARGTAQVSPAGHGSEQIALQWEG